MPPLVVPSLNPSTEWTLGTYHYHQRNVANPAQHLALFIDRNFPAGLRVQVKSSHCRSFESTDGGQGAPVDLRSAANAVITANASSPGSTDLVNEPGFRGCPPHILNLPRQRARCSAFRLRVAAAFFAESERLAAERAADALPPVSPPLRAAG